MDPKLELTKSQLEKILRLINDVSLNGDKDTSVNKLASSSNDRQTKTKRITSLSKKRSYSAVNLKNSALPDDPSDQLINESFRKSIASLMASTANETKSPGGHKATRPADAPVKLKRNKSLIELKREKWDRERDELKDSESWYEKFDSFKKKPSDRSKSQPDIHANFEENLLFRSVSRLFSPVSNFDDESIGLSNSYTALQSPAKVPSPPSANDGPANSTANRSTADRSLATSRAPNDQPAFNQLVNQPRRSFRRYAHQYNNVQFLEKRRKQQEYQRQLEAQLAHKRQAAKLQSEQQMLEDRRLEAKLVSEQRQLRKEFEAEHKEELLQNGNGIAWMVSKKEERRAKERQPTSELAERLETKSKELVKLFREAATQTDDEHLPVNKWQTAGEQTGHSILQPVRSNRSALLRNSMPSSKPKWSTRQGQRDEDSRTSILPKLTTTQRANQVLVRKRWNS